MKREVAVGATGNFRRVCPILNRAAVITKHCLCLCLLAKGRSAPPFGMSLCFAVSPGAYALSVLFIAENREHTGK